MLVIGRLAVHLEFAVSSSSWLVQLCYSENSHAYECILLTTVEDFYFLVGRVDTVRLNCFSLLPLTELLDTIKSTIGTTTKTLLRALVSDLLPWTLVQRAHCLTGIGSQHRF